MKICFVNLQAAPLFDPKASGGIGGAEVRSTTIARGLADTGRHDVNFVVRWPTSRTPFKVDRVTVHFETPPPPRLRSRQIRGKPALFWKLPFVAAASYGRSIQKRLVPRLYFRPRVSGCYREIGADIYCCFGVNNCSAQVIRTAKSVGGKSFLFLASDNDLCQDAGARATSIGPYGDIGHLCHYALTHADFVVTQTPWQQTQLFERYGRNSTIIRNPIDLAPSTTASDLTVGSDFALWIGREDSLFKRPDRCIELALRCPGVPFVMIVNKTSQDTFDAMVRHAPSNVTIIERVPFNEIDAYFQAAAVLVNTSTQEGFPNTFLQAAKYGVPILSWTVDPAEMLRRHGCGAVARNNIDKMAEQLRRLSRDGKLAHAIGQRGRQYVEQFHALEGRISELERLLKAAVGETIHLPFIGKYLKNAA